MLKMFGALALGIGCAAVFLITLSLVMDTASRAIHGDEYVDQEDAASQARRNEPLIRMYERDADDAEFQAAQARSKADEMRRRLSR